MLWPEETVISLLAIKIHEVLQSVSCLVRDLRRFGFSIVSLLCNYLQPVRGSSASMNTERISLSSDLKSQAYLSRPIDPPAL